MRVGWVGRRSVLLTQLLALTDLLRRTLGCWDLRLALAYLVSHAKNKVSNLASLARACHADGDAFGATFVDAASSRQ